MPSFSLRSILALLLGAILAILLIFGGLTVWSFLSFTRFIEHEQRDSLTLGRQYERLMDRWAEVGELRVQAFQRGGPIDPSKKEQALRQLSEIAVSLDQRTEGTRYESQWQATRKILREYVEGVERLDGMLASWSRKILEQRQERERFVETFLPRMAELFQGLETAQTLLKDRQTASAPVLFLAETVAELQGHLQEYQELFSPDQMSRLNQPKMDRLETLIESRLQEFRRAFRTVPPSFDGEGNQSWQKVAEEIERFGRGFASLQETLGNPHFSLALLEEKIHLLDQHLRQLRNQGLENCLNESDLIWGEIEQDSQDLLVQVREKFLVRFLFLALFTFLASLGVFWVPTALSGPLEQLRQRFSQVSPGKVVPPASPSRILEIDDLEGSFQEMVRHVNESTALQTGYFETLTRLPEAFAVLYHPGRAGQGLSVPSAHQALVELFPLLSHQMTHLVAGQVWVHRQDSWKPAGIPLFAEVRESPEPGLEDRLRQVWTALAASPAFPAWLKEEVMVDPLIITPGMTRLERELVLQTPPASLASQAGGDSLPLGFLALRLGAIGTSGRTAGETGFLALGFLTAQAAALTRPDQVFVSVIAQQMNSLIEAFELWAVFRENQAISIQLQMAKDIQKKALPTTIPPTRCFDCQATFRMASEVGGDFYDLLPFPDGRLGVVVADVSGKNVPAALLAMALKSAIHSLPAERLSPKDLVDKLNQVLLDIVSGEHFVTLVYVLLEPADHRMILCNAGHMPVLHLVQPVSAGLAAWRSLQFPDVPLGLFPHSYAEQTIPLGPGDRLILYTDGVTDCLNPAGERLGEKRFLEILGMTGGKSLDSLLEALDGFRGPIALPDDLTVVSVTVLSPLSDHLPPGSGRPEAEFAAAAGTSESPSMPLGNEREGRG